MCFALGRYYNGGFLLIGSLILWYVFLICWSYAPSIVGVLGSVYQVVGFSMVGKVVLLFSFVVEVPMSL